MKLYHFKTGPISVNTYVCVNEKTNEAVAIDTGGNYKRIKAEEKENGYKIIAVILTHGHFDHAGACAELQKDGVKIYISEKDASMLFTDGNLASSMNCPFNNFTADYTFKGGDVLSIAGINFKVLSTPGHTSGSVCFITDDFIFSGDTIFKRSVGRTDFPTGDFKTLIKSIKEQLFTLSGDYKIYPGHEDFTTLSDEKQYNPFMEFGYDD